VLVRREHFDHFLVEKAQEAGAEFKLGEVVGLSDGEDGISIETRDARFLAQSAIIAQGATGNLIRHVRDPDGRGESGICLECRLPTENLDRDLELEGLIDVYFGFPRSGYGWIFNHGTFSSVGIGGLRSILKHPRRAFHEFCRGVGVQVNDSDVHGHLIPCFGHRKNIVADRVLLAGDAAGFVDPFLGEGISYAIRSGQLAAETLAIWIERGELSARRLAEYAKTCYDEFGRDLRYSRYLWRLMQCFPSVFLKMLASERSLLEQCIEAPLKASGYRDFLWRLVLHPAKIF
jgi:flavin-dependent dehydrogenase